MSEVGIRSVRFHRYQDEDAWTWAAAVAIAATLRRELEQRPRARLLLSGGQTPAPVFRALSKAPLEWARIDVGLVDERWLRPDDHDSNAWLVRTHLLQGHAATARFHPLTRSGSSIAQAVANANLHARIPPCIVILGMGDDGHTASMFPGMRGLEAALASDEAYVAVDAEGCPGAGPWPLRISLTPRGLAPAPSRLLLIRGERKRTLFERALAGEDPRELPVRIGFTTPGGSLDVYWCP